MIDDVLFFIGDGMPALFFEIFLITIWPEMLSPGQSQIVTTVPF
jgi:hypothetical protein